MKDPPFAVVEAPPLITNFPPWLSPEPECTEMSPAVPVACPLLRSIFPLDSTIESPVVIMTWPLPAIDSTLDIATFPEAVSPSPLPICRVPPDSVFAPPAFIVKEPPIIPEPADNRIPDPGLWVSRLISAACSVLFPAATIESSDSTLPLLLPEVIVILPLDFPGDLLELIIMLPLDATPTT